MDAKCIFTESRSLYFDTFPFLIGFFDSYDNLGLPTTLPFTLALNAEQELIHAENSSYAKKCLNKAYLLGNCPSSYTGTGTFAEARVKDILANLAEATGHGIEGMSVLEIGCADGYILNRLREAGARRVAGCEPSPMALEGKKKYHIEIVNDFFRNDLFHEKYDLITSYYVHEHISSPGESLRIQRKLLNDGGILFMAVPNCESFIMDGNIEMLSHEHYNYFTPDSIASVLRKTGFGDVKTAIGENEATLYAWATKNDENETIVRENEKSGSMTLFNDFSRKAVQIQEIFKEKSANLAMEGKTIGLYGGGINTAVTVDLAQKTRFFDGDFALHGKYYPGFENPIEDPLNLRDKPVDSLWIMAVNYNDEIIRYLRDEVKIPDRVEIFSFRDFIRHP